MTAAKKEAAAVARIEKRAAAKRAQWSGWWRCRACGVVLEERDEAPAHCCEPMEEIPRPEGAP